MVAGMDYTKDYLNFHKKGGYHSAPLCEEAYKALEVAIHKQMEYDFVSSSPDLSAEVKEQNDK